MKSAFLGLSWEWIPTDALDSCDGFTCEVIGVGLIHELALQ
ncbi:hypothetical protein [Microcystis panniformis]|uniref:Uncharacterized protein n=1 Tax=Microcystis panniformis FACHB-1757 TaxID=1638788 RepID=A0A0K1RU75_9CHRO|nr:hypothetical protein [Microcystis panniformis]AKV65360.1 hypothetical protein VL20_119 [Microcystis panniformis FACHB-1757]